MFYEYLGEIFRLLKQEEDGAWFISYDHPREPRFISESEKKSMRQVAPPASFLKCVEKESTEGQKRREALIFPLVINEKCIFDRKERRKEAEKVAQNNQTTVRRIQLLYYKHLAGRPLVEEREVVEKPKTDAEKIFAWAIEEFYYSAKKFSLKTVYDLMILARFMDENGKIQDDCPSWHQFRHFFYDNGYHNKNRNSIARDGLSSYQRNQRPLNGSAMAWRKRIGAYQMDATQADIYLVSKNDKTSVIGRPNIYLAVDTATQLIAGIYVGLESGEQAVLACICNAAENKVNYCKKYGIRISPEEWPSQKLPSEIITDKGTEFIGKRVLELVSKFGIDLQTLPPFRPDGKGLVEKSFDLLQERYKPILRGKGVIEEDSAERWSTDYRSQAVLNLDEFTKIVIHAVLYLNSCRILQNCPVSASVTAPVPSKLWNWYMEQGMCSLIEVDEEQLYRLSLPRTEASVSRKGISFNGLLYVHKYYRRIFEDVKSKSKITIAYDPDNVESIYVITDEEWVRFELSEAHKKYAGVSESELKDQKRADREEMQKFQRIETEGRVKFLKEVQEIVSDKEYVVKGKLKMETIKENRSKEAER